MEVTLKDGTVLKTEVQDPTGSVSRPLTRQQAMQKAEGFLKMAYAGREKEVMESILGLNMCKNLPVWKKPSLIC